MENMKDNILNKNLVDLLHKIINISKEYNKEFRKGKVLEDDIIYNIYIQKISKISWVFVF